MNKQKGFSLFETVVVAGVALIIGTFLVGIMVNHTIVFNRQSSMVTQGLSTDDATREIESYVKQAASVVSGYPEAGPTYITGNETLVVKIPSVNAQGIISNTFDFVVITKDIVHPNVLKEYIFPDAQSTRDTTDKAVTNILNSIVFSYLDKDGAVTAPTSAVKVKTEISVLSKTSQKGQPRSATVITSLRNI